MEWHKDEQDSEATQHKILMHVLIKIMLNEECLGNMIRWVAELHWPLQIGAYFVHTDGNGRQIQGVQNHSNVVLLLLISERTNLNKYFQMQL